MRSSLAIAVRCLLLLIFFARIAAAQPMVDPAGTSVTESFLLAAPDHDGPVKVHASFQLVSISQIDDQAEKMELSGVLTLMWKDTRQSFNPIKEGVNEKVFSGAYQFNEIWSGWYPQVTLANTAGQYDSRAILLRVQPDGTCTLSEAIEAVAKVRLNMRRFPFDRQCLDLNFGMFGFAANDTAFATNSNVTAATGDLTKVPQWTLESIKASVRTIEPNASGTGGASAFVLTLDLSRDPLFMLRLVVLPLSLIVMLSWAVFWMDRSSLGDRMSVSFVGILTAVAYQITLVGIVPSVSYITWMNGFLNLSFLLMCATVVINLYVGIADRQGHQLGDRIDRRCRWIFPATFFGLNAVALSVAYLFF